MCFEIMKAEVSVYALRGWGRGLRPEQAALQAQAPAPVIQRPGWGVLGLGRGMWLPLGESLGKGCGSWTGSGEGLGSGVLAGRKQEALRPRPGAARAKHDTLGDLI